MPGLKDFLESFGEGVDSYFYGDNKVEYREDISHRGTGTISAELRHFGCLFSWHASGVWLSGSGKRPVQRA